MRESAASFKVVARLARSSESPSPMPPTMHRLADCSYDADPVRGDLEAWGGTSVIPTKRNYKGQVPANQPAYAMQNRIVRGAIRGNDCVQRA